MIEETTADARRRLLPDLDYHRKMIEHHRLMLVTGAQELEELAAREEGRPYRFVYAELSENTGWELRILSDDVPEEVVDMIRDHLSGLRGG